MKRSRQCAVARRVVSLSHLFLASVSLAQPSPATTDGANMTTRPIEALERRQLLATETYDWKAATIKANGFIDGIVYSPAESGLSYIHTDMGGAYRYDTSRAQWVNLTDFAKFNDSAAKNMGVETLAVDPTNADRVYLGLGTYMQNSAVLRSADRGQTWQRTNVPFQMNGNGSGRNTGERMRVDPNSPNILFYGTRDDGLFKSTDSAATWSKVNSFPTIGLDSGFGTDTGILFVEYDKTSSTAGTATQTIYSGVFDPTAGVTRIYRSLDAGVTWGALPGGQPTTANLFPQRAALTPDGNTLYITYANSTTYPGPYGLSNGKVWKVTNPDDAAPIWTDITPPAPNYSYSAITIDPTDPNIVYAGEMGDYNPADRIWRSVNAGASWTVITPNSNRDDSSAQYAKSQGVHWLGDLQIDPFNRDVAMFTTGYGLYRTTNLTNANPTWTFFNEGFEQSAALEIASPNTGPVNLFTAIGDRDGYRHVDFDQSPAIGLFGQNNGLNKGTSDDVDLAWNDANYAVRVVRTSPYVQWSSDNGITWKWLNATGVTGGDGGSLAMSGDGTRVVYEPAGASTNRMLYATRTGTTWSAWASPATNTPADGAKLTVDLVDGNTFYAVAGRTVSRSADGGVNWTVMSTNVLPNGVNWMRAVPNNAGHLVTSAQDNGVWRSTNGGASWTRLAASTVTNAYAVGIGAAAPGGSYPAIFVAGAANSTTGFFRSDDAGVTWITVSDVDHQFGYTTVIQGDPRVFGRIYVGTNGRGIQVGEPLKAPTNLPTGWLRQDIGAPALVGQSGGALSNFTLAGNGTGIGISADQFHLASTAAIGDVTISARIVGAGNASSNARAGVMFRTDTSANSPFALVSQLSNGKIVFSYRTTAGGATQATSPTGTFGTAKYVRLIRTGDTFTAAYSADGTNWADLAAPVTITMPATIRAGLAASAGTTAELAKASITNVVLITDTIAPTTTTTFFDYRKPVPAVEITFSEDVFASLSVDDLSIVPTAGGDAVVSTSFAFDPATFTARFDLPAAMPRGDYHLALAAGSVADRAGNTLASATSLDFFHLPGDIDRDRTVGFSDLVILAQHYGETDAPFESGDLTANATVGFEDLVILAQNYGTTVLQEIASFIAPIADTKVAAKPKASRGRVATDVL
jgi:hypothetical protein